MTIWSWRDPGSQPTARLGEAHELPKRHKQWAQHVERLPDTRDRPARWGLRPHVAHEGKPIVGWVNGLGVRASVFRRVAPAAWKKVRGPGGPKSASESRG
jgi:hypothetical protein